MTEMSLVKRANGWIKRKSLKVPEGDVGSDAKKRMRCDLKFAMIPKMVEGQERKERM